MSRYILLIGLAAARIAVADQAETWVRQTDLTNGMLYDIPLSPTGGPFAAPLPISEMGSTFELFALGNGWDTKIYHLDTKLIRAYAPKVKVDIVSEDPYVRGDPLSSTYVRRTRADRPFSVKIDITGLVPASTSQAEKHVYFNFTRARYSSDTFSALGVPEEPVSATNLGNGTVSMNGLYHQLGMPLSAGCGAQTYTFVRYAADGVPDTILAQPKIEVWPVATATAENIRQNEVFTDRIPSVTLHLRSLYPDSTTFAQVYSGPAVLGTDGRKIKGTERSYGAYYNPGAPDTPTNVPQNVAITVVDLSNYAVLDGIYTLEVITVTPFNARAPERLLAITFEVDRVISSRGQFSTAER